jgi:predicted thioesterase
MAPADQRSIVAVMTLDPGIVGRANLTVGDADTASALGSGDVPVLGTPRLVALAEAAAVDAVAGELEEGQTTVGTSVQLDHVAPTPVGGKVEAEATLARIEGRRLVFRIRVTDERGLVAAGKHMRALVDRERFIEKASSTEGAVNGS